MGRESRVNGRSWRDRKVVFGYPCGGSVTVPFHASCLRLLSHELGKPDKERLLVRMHHATGLYVGDNRQVLVEKMLDETDAGWLLQVDTDIEFPETLIETLLDLAGDDKKILAATVPLGTAYPSCAFTWTGTPGVYGAIEADFLSRQPFEVDAIATAVVLIHREVFEKMADEYGKSWFHSIYLAKSPEGTPPRDFAFTGNQEDIAFCMRAKRCGFSVWCVQIPGLGHYKTIRMSHDDDYSKALGRKAAGVGMGVLVEET